MCSWCIKVWTYLTETRKACVTTHGSMDCRNTTKNLQNP